jgi:hypothetical protein
VRNYLEGLPGFSKTPGPEQSLLARPVAGGSMPGAVGATELSAMLQVRLIICPQIRENVGTGSQSLLKRYLLMAACGILAPKEVAVPKRTLFGIDSGRQSCQLGVGS